MPENADKLVIIRGKFRGANVEFPAPGGGSAFTVCFNPTEYTVAKRTSYAEAAIPGLDSPMLQFSRGEARTLSVELMLDTCTYDEGKDVRTEYVKPLESFLLVDGELHAPPPCKLVWGSLEFIGLPESLSTRFVLFQDDGTPVRARATLSFKEYIPISVQLANTPRSSPDRRKTHQLKRGETLWHLANEAYGDPALWRVIAEANEIDKPRAILPGTTLVIPALEPKPGVFAYAR
ncbi:MAG: LysM peptidoglycan-binding domain-containing protein [Verrucomicrobiales bacterium]|nr:LysM peptidoglycan-binding domain-containing protein [Verrucomicrobiales bacterium]